MGQLLSSEQELNIAKEAVGSLLYRVMAEGGAVPDLGVAHPLLLADHGENLESSGARLQEQLRQLQADIGNKAPTYLKDLIGRLSSFAEEPRLAGLLGLAVTLVMDMAYTSSKRASGVKGKSAGSSTSQQRVWELQELMEEYLKRCRINLSDRERLIQDSLRLEAQLSLALTQLKMCMLGGDCSSRSLRHWASGAALHTQMLVHLAGLEGKAEPLAAQAALEQYKEDLTQILPAYRRFKSSTVCVVKRRGGYEGSEEEDEVEGSMTGLTVTDRETGRSVSVSRAAMQEEAAGMRASYQGPALGGVFPVNLDLITSDQYAQAYLDHLFSERGPLAELQGHFSGARDNPRTEAAGGERETQKRRRRDGEEDKEEEEEQRGEALKLSIVETQR